MESQIKTEASTALTLDLITAICERIVDSKKTAPSMSRSTEDWEDESAAGKVAEKRRDAINFQVGKIRGSEVEDESFLRFPPLSPFAWTKYTTPGDKLRNGLYHNINAVLRMGRRYEKCTVENFVATTAEQKKAQAQVSDYIENLAENVSNGVGLVLYGPVGTGKDHLMSAVLREAILNHPYVIDFWTGAGMFAAFRALIEAKRDETAVVGDFRQFDILALSDPIPASGTATDYQIQTLFQILDHRYRQGKPTFSTINCANRADADARLSVPIADRLLDKSAVKVACNWPSFRRGGT